jgi:N6-L-threonylcarbamoyladenine synthase
MPNEDLVLLAVETSCDDTAAAVYAGGRVVSSIVASQAVHARFGGVVPELASRAHQQLIVPTIEAALADAGVSLEDLTAVSATYGPGLAGSLLVGLSFTKALAVGLDVPFVGVNHLEGHVYSVFVDEPHPPFPFLCLTVSGGHTQLVLVEEGFRHTTLGRTRDDAAGEAFDKVAKLLGLGYPGGPIVDRLAAGGNASFHRFPSPRMAGGYDFSFSGIKTAVRYFLDALTPAEREQMLAEHTADICASFQAAVVTALARSVRDAVRETGVRAVAIVGGVSANSALRATAAAAAREDGFELFVPALRYSVDNAAMIAVTAAFKLAAGQESPLSLQAEPALKL